MRIAIHQPNFAPWLGYMHKWATVDLFVELDHVQFTKNGYQNRVRIKGSVGPKWLTVPVLHHFGQRTSEVRVNNNVPWGEKLLNTLQTDCGRAAFFGQYRAELGTLLTVPYSRLVEVNEAILQFLKKSFAIDTRTIQSSILPLDGLSGSELILGICEAVGADTYVSGPSGRNYLDETAFTAAGIRVTYDDFVHPNYRQLHGEFAAGLSSLDLLFNEGPQHAASLLREPRQ